MEWNGQLKQDEFAAYVLSNKRGGTFLDVGCHAPKEISNTYTLEHSFGWTGVGIDIVPEFAVEWERQRPGSRFVAADAREVDWAELYASEFAGERIDYLSLDLEPPQQALGVLESMLNDGLSFNAITFEHDYYRQRETRDKSRQLLMERGYKLIHKTDQDDFWIHADVPSPKQAEKLVSVAALMTAPRHEIVLARNHIEAAVKKMGIPLTISGGVFYGQCMQTMLSDVVNKGIKYALTIDFDSMFTAEHIQRLLNLISHNDHIDAIAACEPKRGIGTILAARDVEQTIAWDGLPVQVTSAHFGLTVIDCEKLREVPKPWFLAVPDENGEWEGNKIDDDVYFWKAWKNAGHSLYIDPGCRLGHLEEMVTYYDTNMQKQHAYPNEWSKIRASTVNSSVEASSSGEAISVDG